MALSIFIEPFQERGGERRSACFFYQPHTCPSVPVRRSVRGERRGVCLGELHVCVCVWKSEGVVKAKRQCQLNWPCPGRGM